MNLVGDRLAGLRAQHAIHGIRYPPRGFVIVADLHLSQQSQRKKLDAGHDNDRSEDEQRTMHVHDVGVVYEVVEDQPEGDERSRKNAGCSEGAEEVQRARQVVKQETNRNQVKEDAEGSGYSVVRLSTLTIDVANGNLANRRSVPGRKRGNKPVQFAVQGHLVDDFAAVGLERRPKVMDIDAAELCHQPICAARRKAAHHKVVDALLAPSAHDVIALCDLFQEKRNVIRIVLEIAVHRDQVVAGSVIESSGEGRGLTEVSAELDHRHATIDGRDLAEQMEGKIGASIVNKDQLKALGIGFHHPFQAVIENGYVLLFVMEGDHNRILRHADQDYSDGF